MAGHNPSERRLFTDIRDKNRLAAEIRRLTLRTRRWQERMGQRTGKRWQAQYGGSLRRAEQRIEALRNELIERASDLETRIREEQKVSAKEIKQFHDQFKKEVEELKADQAKLAESRQAVAKAEDAAAKAEPSEARKHAELLEALSRRHRGLYREAEREAKDVKKAKQEIASEERDKVVLAVELKRVIGELEALGA